jgi:hypothetical protein
MDTYFYDDIKENISIWDTPKFKRLLSQPIGSPIDLTKEEADEIIRLAAGRRPDLPSGSELKYSFLHIVLLAVLVIRYWR